MKNLAVVNALAVTPYARQPLPDGTTPLERVAAYTRMLPGVTRAVLLVREPVQVEGFDVETLTVGPESPWPSIGELLRRLQKLCGGYDNLFYVFGDCPLLDAALAASMLDNHGKYLADYTFADGYPYGLAPEILKVGVLPSLVALAERISATETPSTEGRADRQGLFDLIKRDINAFDLETELSPVDLRLLRAELCTDSRRNTLLVERLLAAGADDAASVCRLLQERPESLRTLPAFVAVQIVEGCPQLCTYCPYGLRVLEQTGKQAEMEPEAFERIVAQVQTLCGDAVIGVSLWGEPAFHSRFAELAGMVVTRGLSLLVETSGLGWPEGSLAATASLGGSIDWVVSLDATDPELYRRLRGEGREEALGTVERLLGLFPGRVYPQAVRMTENEENLEEFYRHWKKTAGNVIIQKYDHFCGVLPDRKAADLAPLKRLPCWHLKRDLAVLIDGRVPLCREDLQPDHGLGNLFDEPLEEIWQRGEPFYRRHLGCDYPGLCARCDEYYSFSF